MNSNFYFFRTKILRRSEALNRAAMMKTNPNRVPEDNLIRHITVAYYTRLSRKAKIIRKPYGTF